MSTKANSRWYDEVREITERLVRINSISPSVAGENAGAAEITQALAERGLTPGYWKTGGDERKNVWTMLEGGAVPPDGQKIPTVILIGHHDQQRQPPEGGSMGRVFQAPGKGERVYMPYSFETVPELIHNVVLRVLRDAESET
jgi:arginine utilization protein RocB